MLFDSDNPYIHYALMTTKLILSRRRNWKETVETQSPLLTLPPELFCTPHSISHKSDSSLLRILSAFDNVMQILFQ